jgi:glyoxylase-like metal-dependent hydrolase (beta-lactamase superfamily II)
MELPPSGYRLRQDALMVHLPASGVLFAGDVMMPYLGQPFAAEGSPEGLLEALAVEIIQPGLLCHPASVTLAGLRRTALHRLMEQHQQFDPFKFLIYAELAGAEIGPVE